MSHEIDGFVRVHVDDIAGAVDSFEKASWDEWFRQTEIAIRDYMAYRPKRYWWNKPYVPPTREEAEQRLKDCLGYYLTDEAGGTRYRDAHYRREHDKQFVKDLQNMAWATSDGFVYLDTPACNRLVSHWPLQRAAQQG